VDVILPPSDRVSLDPSGKALRSQATMDLPFVEVGSLLTEQRCLREKIVSFPFPACLKNGSKCA
jgi:hypothetical protein